MAKWSLPEVIRLLELFTLNELWDNRVLELEKDFGNRHSPNFFTVQSCKRELHRLFSQPNPEHVNGLPTHPRSKEAAEMWLKHYRKKLLEEQENSKQVFWVGIRQILDMIQKYKNKALKLNNIIELRDQQRNKVDNFEVVEKQMFEDCVNKFMKQVYAEDLENVSTADDLLKFIRGERIPHADSNPKLIIKSPKASLSCSPSIQPSEKADVETFFDITAIYPNASVVKFIKVNKISISKNIVLPSVSPAVVSTMPPAKKKKFDKLEDISKTSLVKSDIKETFKLKETVVKSILASEQRTTRLRRSDGIVSQSTDSNNESILSLRTKQVGQKVENVEVKDSLKSKESNKSNIIEQRFTRLRRSDAIVLQQKTDVRSESFKQISLKETKPEINKQIVSKTETDLKESKAVNLEQRATRLRRSDVVVLQQQKIDSSNQFKNDFAYTSSKIELGDSKELIKTKLAKTGSAEQRTKRNRRNDIATSDSQQVEIGIESKTTSTTKFDAKQINSKIDLDSKKVINRPRRGTTLSEEIANFKRNYTSNEKIGKNVLLSIFNKILALKYSNIFYHPVLETDVPGYHEAVKKPMDLLTIKKSIDSGSIETFAQFSNDIVLMFANAIMFNSTDHDVNLAAKDLQQQSLKFIMEAQYPMGEFFDSVQAEQIELRQ